MHKKIFALLGAITALVLVAVAIGVPGARSAKATGTYYSVENAVNITDDDTNNFETVYASCNEGDQLISGGMYLPAIAAGTNPDIWVTIVDAQDTAGTWEASAERVPAYPDADLDGFSQNMTVFAYCLSS